MTFQIFLAILAALFLLCPPLNSFIKENGAESEIQTQPELTWDQYSTSCQRSSWDKRSEAEMQIGCIGLNGVKINWRGVVENVKVTKVHNSILKVGFLLRKSHFHVVRWLHTVSTLFCYFSC